MARYIEDPSDPDHVIDVDELDHVARQRTERAVATLPTDDGRRERLALEEAELPELPSANAPGPRRSVWLVFAFIGLGLLFAVMVRLATAPFRRPLTRWRARRADRARVRALESAMAKERQAERAQTAAAWLACGLAWSNVGRPARAESAFDAALRATNATGAMREAAMRNRGVVRSRMGLPKLGARDIATSRMRVRRAAWTTLVEAALLAWFALQSIAGLEPSD